MWAFLAFCVVGVYVSLHIVIFGIALRMGFAQESRTESRQPLRERVGLAATRGMAAVIKFLTAYAQRRLAC